MSGLAPDPRITESSARILNYVQNPAVFLASTRKFNRDASDPLEVANALRDLNKKSTRSPRSLQYILIDHVSTHFAEKGVEYSLFENLKHASHDLVSEVVRRARKKGLKEDVIAQLMSHSVNRVDLARVDDAILETVVSRARGAFLETISLKHSESISSFGLLSQLPLLIASSQRHLQVLELIQFTKKTLGDDRALELILKHHELPNLRKLTWHRHVTPDVFTELFDLPSLQTLAICLMSAIDRIGFHQLTSLWLGGGALQSSLTINAPRLHTIDLHNVTIAPLALRSLLSHPELLHLSLEDCALLYLESSPEAAALKALPPVTGCRLQTLTLADLDASAVLFTLQLVRQSTAPLLKLRVLRCADTEPGSMERIKRQGMRASSTAPDLTPRPLDLTTMVSLEHLELVSLSQHLVVQPLANMRALKYLNLTEMYVLFAPSL